jgi:hypothetical protein
MLLKPRNSDAVLPGLTAMRLGAMPPALLGMLLQLAASGVILFLAKFSPLNLTLFGFAIVQGVLAAILARMANMPRWWLAIEFLFAPSLFGALSLQLSSSWYLAGFVLLALVYWSVCSTRVPLFLSSSRAHTALAELLPDSKGFSMIDLGSGLGGVLARLSAIRSDGNYIGVETAPLPFVISKLRLASMRNCRVIWGNFWQRDLGHIDVVYAYLSPVPMAQLWQKVKLEMKPGSLFISNTFTVPGVAPDRTIPLDDMSSSILYVWQI